MMFESVFNKYSSPDDRLGIKRQIIDKNKNSEESSY